MSMKRNSCSGAKHRAAAGGHMPDHIRHKEGEIDTMHRLYFLHAKYPTRFCTILEEAQSSTALM